MDDGSRVDDESAVITLGDGAQLVPEKDRGRLLHCKRHHNRHGALYNIIK